MEESGVDFHQVITWTAQAAEAAGVFAMLFGSVVATGWIVVKARSLPRREVFHRYRSAVGKAILLGLEFLIMADIIRTISESPTVRSVLVLGGIVLIRTFLSLSLQVEIEGRFPWQAKAAS